MLCNISHKNKYVKRWKQAEVKQDVDIQEEIQKLKNMASKIRNSNR